MKYLLAVAATLVYVTLLLGTYAIHARFLAVDVVLYSAIADAAIAAALGAAILFGFRWAGAFSTFEKFQLLVIWLLSGFIFAISLPTVVDRSLSFYILEKLQQRGGSIALAGFEDIFRNEYMHEHRLVEVRLTEQEASGTIRIVDGCVTLTERGQSLARFSRFFRTNFLPRHRLISGEYSSDLTDPFRSSTASAAAPCHRP